MDPEADRLVNDGITQLIGSQAVTIVNLRVQNQLLHDENARLRSRLSEFTVEAQDEPEEVPGTLNGEADRADPPGAHGHPTEAVEDEL